MTKSVNTYELAIALVAKQLNPSALNPDFLKYSGIIPADWELARPPVYSQELMQLVFKNGVGVIAQPNRLVFVETITDTEQQPFQVAKLVKQCVEKLPNLEYQALGINPKGLVTFSDQSDDFQYVIQHLMGHGPWQSFGTAAAKASVQLVYPLERGQLNLTINEATIQTSDDNQVPASVFASNFNYPLEGDSPEARLQDLDVLLSNWQTTLESYENLINTKFLPAESSLMQAS